MTKRQRQVLDFIMAYQVEHSVSPTMREISDHLGVTSVSTAWEHLRALQRNGYIRLSYYEPRSIVVLDTGKALFVCSKCGGT